MARYYETYCTGRLCKNYEKVQESPLRDLSHYQRVTNTPTLVFYKKGTRGLFLKFWDFLNFRTKKNVLKFF